MRLFVAVDLPEEEKERIWRACEPVREAGLPLRWVPAGNLHLTLKFLGEVAHDAATNVVEALERAARVTAPFTLDLGRFGAFPSLRRPRVLWLGIDPSGPLAALREAVERELAGCGFRAEEREFHPHVTLARADARAPSRAFRELAERAASLEYGGRVAVGTLDLMRSHLARSGARYEVMRRCPLGGAR